MTVVAGGIAILALLAGLVIVVAVIAGAVWVAVQRRNHRD
jgi:heme/copper-type cytochrome/quinol oxidase subunit 4